MSAVLFDLDGVFYVGDQPVPGGAGVIDWVQQENIPHLFVTNTTSRPRSALVEKLAAYNIHTDEESIFTPPVAACQWLKQRETLDKQPQRIALFVPEATIAEFSEFAQDDEHPHAVIVGDLGDGWTYDRLNQAFRLLMVQPGTALIALGMTRYWQAPDGLRLDVAPFVTALSMASGRSIKVLGKPEALFFQAAISKLGGAAMDTIMIGDDIRGDVGGAQAAGLQGVQVRTGKFREDDLNGDITPDAVLDSIADFPAWYQSQ